MTKKLSNLNDQPLKENTSLIFYLSAAITLLMAFFSGTGLLLPNIFYPDPGMLEQYLANDLVNILLGLPLFLVSLILVRREKLLGALLLPGALIYVVYNYIAYLLGRAWNWIAIINAGLVLLSIITLVLLLRALDHQAIKNSLEGKVGEKTAGWILVIFGLAFLALAVSTIFTGIQEGTIPPLGENAVSVADIVVSMCWVYGGFTLLQKKTLAYSIGLGLLVAASGLFIGLILFFFLAPLITARPFDWVEVFTILVMGLICFIPTGLFCRGILRSTSGPAERSQYV